MKTFCCIVGVMAVVSVAFANGVASWLRMQKDVIRQHRDALAAMYTNDIQVFVSDCRHSHGIRVDYAVTQYGEILRGRSDFFPDAPKLSPVRRLDGEERLTLRTRIAELRPYISGGMYAVWISVREGDSLTATFAYPKECPTNEAAAKLLGMLAEMAGATNAVRESRKR